MPLSSLNFYFLYFFGRGGGGRREEGAVPFMPYERSEGSKDIFRAIWRLDNILIEGMMGKAINRFSFSSRVFCGWEKAVIMKASEAWCHFVNKGFIRTRRTPSGPGALPG